jgi:hypothetical protein
MDSQGFVALEFIAGFKRMKQLSTDLELIKLVCQQSNVVQYRTGEDCVNLQSRSQLASISQALSSGLCLQSRPQALMSAMVRFQ